MNTLMAQPVVVDLRKIYRAEEMVRNGFVYVSVGTATENLESRDITFQNGVDVIKNASSPRRLIGPVSRSATICG